MATGGRRDRDTLVRLDMAHVWHPFTQMRGWLASEPLVIERGEGCWLVDVDGRRYIDGVSSLWVNVHGHTVPEIDQAVSAQLGRIAHSTLLGLANVASTELAAELVALGPPGLEKVFYSEAGACAVEVALKMAFGYWRHRGVATKRTFLSLEHGYHGDTLGAVSVGGIDLFHAAYQPLLFPTFKAPSPYCYRCPLGLTHPACDIACLGPLESILEDHAREICAVVVEPLVQAAGGMITAPAGYLRRVRELCDAHDVLLICELPDNISAAALSMAVSAGGAVKVVETQALITFEDGVSALKKAKAAEYAPPPSEFPYFGVYRGHG